VPTSPHPSPDFVSGRLRFRLQERGFGFVVKNGYLLMAHIYEKSHPSPGNQASYEIINLSGEGPGVRGTSVPTSPNPFLRLFQLNQINRINSVRIVTLYNYDTV